MKSRWALLLRLVGGGTIGAILGAFACATVPALPARMANDSEARAIRTDMAHEGAPGFTAQVCFRTPEPGAKVTVRSVSAERAIVLGYTNSPEAAVLTLGLYDVWTERDGRVTDLRESYPVTQRSLVIDLEGDTSRIARCN